ncbi:hypothetical protein QJS10_CPB11g01022 [Acorus calamus]|uniref:LysM domain-containing protein n=1 Tax=Acorus calamus TaxID=4465 RepID=A0AAV9DVX9_ACOCL|nr:hypothetical protein QJS10_CPB11g01022 [Acorus calamus]
MVEVGEESGRRSGCWNLDGRVYRPLKVGFTKPAPQCFSVYGVESGDTCFAIRQEFNLTAAEFGAVNPNLECDKLFPGQWLCVVGRA